MSRITNGQTKKKIYKCWDENRNCKLGINRRKWKDEADEIYGKLETGNWRKQVQLTFEKYFYSSNSSEMLTQQRGIHRKINRTKFYHGLNIFNISNLHRMDYIFIYIYILNKLKFTIYIWTILCISIQGLDWSVKIQEINIQKYSINKYKRNKFLRMHIYFTVKLLLKG